MSCLRALSRPDQISSLWVWGTSPSGAISQSLSYSPPNTAYPLAVQQFSQLIMLPECWGAEGEGWFKCAPKLQALNPNDFKLDKGTKRLLWENVCPVIAHEHTSNVSLQELRHPPVLQKGPSSQAKLMEQLDRTLWSHRPRCPDVGRICTLLNHSPMVP